LSLMRMGNSMRTVCITGHRPDSFIVSHYSVETVQRIADDVASVLKREYGDELQFNLGGAIGADQWMGAAAIENGIRYNLYLPFHPSIQARHWNAAQRSELDRQIKSASGIFITDPDGDYNPKRYFERNIAMVDNGDFTVAFWVGRRRGGTFNAMKYSLSKSKFVFNALDGFRPIFKQDLEAGWTPEHMR